MTTQDKPEEPVRVLLVAAHPDDPEAGCGGTVAQWVREGKEVYYLLCTRGNRGSNDREMTPERLAPLREGEQRRAATVLGVKEVTFLDFDDGTLEPNLALRAAIVREIRRVRPKIVMTHDPTVHVRRTGLNHPDHRACGTATLDAIFPSARDHLSFPEHLKEGLEPHRVEEVYLWGSSEPNVKLEISDTVELKVEALSQHESQFGSAQESFARMRQRWRGNSNNPDEPPSESFFHLTMGFGRPQTPQQESGTPTTAASQPAGRASS